jgi:signal transduction histidine kinase
MQAPKTMDVSTREHTLKWFAERLALERAALARQWLDRVEQLEGRHHHDLLPADQRLEHVSNLIAQAARYLEAPNRVGVPGIGVARQAAVPGEHQDVRDAPLHHLLREHEILADVLEGFIANEMTAASVPQPLLAVRAIRRIGEFVRAVEKNTVDSFVASYTETIERQASQLRAFSRLVSHEIRQPLGVLQVIAKALPVPTTDADSVRMMDMFDRSVRRLTDVTGKLERLARLAGGSDVLPSERRVNLTEVARTVAAQLSTMAAERDVQVRVDPNLPVVRLDPARAELILLNLMANAIQFADPGKAERYVEIYARAGDASSLIVRDNGMGMPRPLLQTIFREFAHAHGQRDDDGRVQGLGLGLTIVRECMDHSNGSVRVESVEGRGTTVKLSWPTRS